MKLSVIIPVYNSELYIAECIESIVNQTYSNVELFVVDGGLTDRGIEILSRLKSNYEFTLIYQKHEIIIALSESFDVVITLKS